MHLYLKCVIANKGTLFGYFLMVLGLICISLDLYFVGKPIDPDQSVQLALLIITLLIGFDIALITEFGFRTLFYYKKVYEHFEKHGFLDDRFMNEFRYKDYCVTVGARLAEREIKRFQSLQTQPN